MSSLDRFMNFLHPTLRLQTTPYLDLWEERERESFRTVSTAFLLIASVAYIIHYFFIDIPLNLQPRSRWLTYRFCMAGVGLLALLLTRNRSIACSTLYRLPTAFAGIIFSYFQVRTMIWFDGVPYFYAFIIASVATVTLQRTVFISMVNLALIFLLQWTTLRNLPLDPVYLVSAAVIAAAWVGVIRSRMGFEIAAFIAEQTHIDTQKKLIQSEMDLNQQIRAFLPGEIYRRMKSHLNRSHMSFHQAIDEVLYPRMKTIACLFTDIRGYTQLTKTSTQFIRESAIPNIRACTEQVELHHGIPRHIGDLIFSYFDASEEDLNLARAITCGMILHDLNQSINGTLPEDLRIRRFILISFGTAMVGNIGGNDSSREITAMGTPANILSRVDELTKNPALKEHLILESLILTSAAAKAVQKFLPTIEIRNIDIHALGIQIRDFPEESAIHILPLTERNREVLRRTPIHENSTAPASATTPLKTLKTA